MNSKDNDTISTGDVNDIIIALYMRRNWIETGNVILGARDAVLSGRPSKKLPVLGDDQKACVARLEALIVKLQNNSVIFISKSPSPDDQVR